MEAKLKELEEKGLVKAMDHGAFTRVVEDTQVQVIYYLNIIFQLIFINLQIP